MPRSFAPIPEGPYSTKILAQIRRIRRLEPELILAIEEKDCEICGAEPGQLCRRVKGQGTGQLAYYHAARTGTGLLTIPA
jgi:hypothetical protein